MGDPPVRMMAGLWCAHPGPTQRQGLSESLPYLNGPRNVPLCGLRWGGAATGASPDLGESPPGPSFAQVWGGPVHNYSKRGRGIPCALS